MIAHKIVFIEGSVIFLACFDCNDKNKIHLLGLKKGLWMKYSSQNSHFEKNTFKSKKTGGRFHLIANTVKV